MLTGLSIRNIVLIDALDLEFGPGLNVLTGETGAGKSILLDALGFALGNRTRGDIVRAGEASGEVTAVFDLAADHPARTILDELDLPWEEGEPLILRRVSSADGRRTAFVNDRRAPAETLRRLSDTLVEIHGQHDDRGLLDPRGHRALLDAYMAQPALGDAVAEAWRALARARSDLEKAEAAVASARSDEDFLRHAVAELERFAPEPGEDETLDMARRRMQAAARLREDVARAAEALGAEGAEGRVGDASRWLEDALSKADGALGTLLDEPLSALNRAFAEIAEASDGIAAALDALVDDPAELERTEERLFALRALARKHSVAPDDLASLAAELSARLEAIDAGDAHLSTLRKAVSVAEADYDRAATALTEARQAAAVALDAAVAAELAPLRMDAARFETRLERAEAGPSGRDGVTFTVATNPGTPAGPIDRIASGGELSRFLLALKVCLSARADGLTMIFDEIDRGVGGATADAVGRRLSTLAQEAQVLVVTHSPQVAARGAHHFRIAKSSDGITTRTDVSELGQGDRLDEIARMLAGDTITDAARAAALELLRG
ncbi:MAG: DNA repair protein RecN [Rubricella sp.]